MRLSELERRESFALLGPGFGDGGFLLVEDLRETRESPVIAYAPFEARGSEARLLGGRIGAVDVEFDVAAAPLEVSLRDSGYTEAVRRIRAAIAAGDVYQVCHTLRAPVAAEGGARILAAMCRGGVPRFAAWVRLADGTEFVAASPELFFETNGNRVHTEPMKGTARPGAGGALEVSEKDRSELAMITDLLRNDLTPVCVPRTVRVASERRLIDLPYAVQAVSDVVGDLAPRTGPLAVLEALHPGGSVTGTPKRAALDMIGELEEGPRGAYCGALGLLREGRSVFSLLIRTAELVGGSWVYGVGSGIVWDSDPRAELEELHVKLGALR